MHRMYDLGPLEVRGLGLIDGKVKSDVEALR